MTGPCRSSCSHRAGHCSPSWATRPCRRAAAPLRPRRCARARPLQCHQSSPSPRIRAGATTQRQCRPSAAPASRVQDWRGCPCRCSQAWRADHPTDLEERADHFGSSDPGAGLARTPGEPSKGPRRLPRRQATETMPGREGARELAWRNLCCRWGLERDDRIPGVRKQPP